MSTMAERPPAGWQRHRRWFATPRDRANGAPAASERDDQPRRSSAVAPCPIDQRRRAVPLQDVNQDHLTAARLHDLVSDHLLTRVITALHQHARANQLD